jgi:branched-chain amino acid transport system ATP-binding protein
VTVILVEQHAHPILRLTRQALVLERGRIACQGASRAVKDDPALLRRWPGVASR